MKNNLNNINLEIEVTNKCNFNCSYCCANAVTSNELDFRQLKYFLKYLFKISKNNFQIIITGGEPFLYKNLNDLLLFLNNNNKVIGINLLTNLSKINDLSVFNKYSKLNFILSSIHKEYYNYYLKNIKYYKKIIKYLCDKKIHIEFNVLLEKFENYDINQLDKLKKIIYEFKSIGKNLNFLTFNAQFITFGNILDNIESKNKTKFEKFLNIKFNSYFNEFKDITKFEENNFNFNGWFCRPRNFMIKYNGNITRDCGSFPVIGNIKNFKDAKNIVIKTIKCNEEKCNPQISGDIERWKSYKG